MCGSWRAILCLEGAMTLERHVSLRSVVAAASTMPLFLLFAVSSG